MDSKYDVFISKNSADSSTALAIANALRQRGFRVFESSESLPQMANAAYSDAIDNALDNSRHLLVICSKNENGANSRWVEYEWQTFREEIFSKRKDGNIVVILVDGIHVADLAIGLRRFQAFEYEMLDFEKLILYFHKDKESRQGRDAIVETPKSIHSAGQEAPADEPAEPDGADVFERIIKIDNLSFRMIRVVGGVYQSKQIDSFYLGQFPITQNIWEHVMGYNPSHFQDTHSKRGARLSSAVKDGAKGFLFGGPLVGFGRGVYSYYMHDTCSDIGHLPVENVDYYDALEFVKRLSEMTGLRFSLPTEMEWEFAAKGGIHSQGFTYAGSDDIDSVGWYKDNSSGKTHSVGEKIPNELGLYDMSGNVWEWVQDSAAKDAGIRKGGSWHQVALQCLCTNRHVSDRHKKTSGLGFRVLLR